MTWDDLGLHAAFEKVVVPIALASFVPLLLELFPGHPAIIPCSGHWSFFFSLLFSFMVPLESPQSSTFYSALFLG